VARTKFRVEVLTPEGEVFNDEVEMVSTRTTVGSIGVLANHQPLLGMLEPTELRLYKSDSDVERFAQGEGYIQVSREQVLVLVEEAIRPNDLNAGDLRERARRAEQSAREAEDGSEEQRRCQRDQRRAEAFLQIAEGGGGGR
jgi:F-type H+-transporting ATPase subunit epsilon